VSEEHHRIRWATIGMLAGIVVFIAGVIMLILVFVWAFALFQGAARVMSGVPLSSLLAQMGLKVALLFIMGYVASLIGSKGLQLYGVCRGVSPR
jgi:hypothetical protein